MIPFRCLGFSQNYFSCRLIFLCTSIERSSACIFGLFVCLFVYGIFDAGHFSWMVGDRAFIFHMHTLWQYLSIGALIFDLMALTLEFDNDGHSQNVPLIGSFIFHKHISLFFFFLMKTVFLGGEWLSVPPPPFSSSKNHYNAKHIRF
jgi:hypothetical protein